MKYIFILFYICLYGFSYAQNNVGIGTNTPHISSKLDISDTSKGILIPRMNSIQRNAIMSPANGLLVYDNDSLAFMYFNGSVWKKIVTSFTETDPQVSSSTTNQIPRWNGSTLIDGIIQDDATNIGIGTAPVSGQKITINGKTTTTNFQMTNGAGAGKILQSDASGNASWVVLDTTKGSTLDNSYDFGGRGNGRIIIADSGAVRINGQDGFIVTGTIGTGDIIETSGTGTRMFFNPRKGAFRAGTVTSINWDHTQLGDNSFASGMNTTASGQNAVAFGNSSFASGNNSIAVGSNSSASGNFSIAMGETSIASGLNSIAMGRFSIASGAYTTNIGGNSNTASGTGATNIGGQGNQSLSFMSVTMGEANTASGSRSMATNLFNTASGENSNAMGLKNSAKSFGEMVIGIGATNYNPSFNGHAFFQVSNATDRLFVIGNAIDSNANNTVDSLERSNALVVLKNGNTAIGNITPNSKLDVDGKTKTINFQMTNGAGANKILQSDASGNASWVNLPSSTDTDSQSLSLSGNNLSISRGNTIDLSTITTNTWKTAGNTGTNPTTNYIGTTDSVDLVFKNNNNQNMRLFADGSWLLGDSMQGAGTKTFFDISKGVFRCGYLDTAYLTLWNKDSLGFNSFTTGVNSNAKGNNSVAMGERSFA